MTALTIEHLRHVLDTRCGGVLRRGEHEPPDDPEGPCEVCTRELTALALGLPWTDEPDGGGATDRACQRLNDGPWSTRAAATEACLPLALLRERDAAEGWVARYAERTIREILPIALRAVGLDEAAERCEREGTAEAAAEARRAAAAAARSAATAAAGAGWSATAAATAAAAAAAAWTAEATRAAAAAAAWTAEATRATRDDVLQRSVQILIECHRGEGL